MVEQCWGDDGCEPPTLQGTALALTLRRMGTEARTARVWRRTLSWTLCFALFSCVTVTGAAAQPAAARPEVTSLTLFGVEAVDEGRLKQVLETRASSWLPWGVNRYFDPEALQRDLQRIVAFYRDHGVAGGEMAVHALQDRGYPYAEVRVFEEQIEPRWVRVRYRAEPGAIAYFGEIEIAGNKSVEDYVIRRELGYKPGELFRRSRLEASQRQLAALDLFEFATVQTLKEGPYPSEVPTRVTVAEGKPTRTKYSVGYGTEEKLRGEISWQHVNFFGGARSFTARGRWSSLDRGGQVDFVQPYFYHPRLTLSFDGHDWFTDETAFDVRSRGGRTALSMAVGCRARWCSISTGPSAPLAVRPR